MRRKICVVAVVLLGLVCALLVTRVPMDYRQKQMTLADWTEQYPQAAACFAEREEIMTPGEFVCVQTCRNFMGTEFTAFSVPCLEADVENVATAGSSFWRVGCGVYTMTYRGSQLVEKGYGTVEDGTLTLIPDDNGGIVGMIAYSSQDIPCEYEGSYPAREATVFIEKDKSAPCSVDLHMAVRDSTIDPNEEADMNAVFCGSISPTAASRPM